MIYFIFFFLYQVFRIQWVCYTYSTLQFGDATCQWLSSHVQLAAAILDHIASESAQTHFLPMKVLGHMKTVSCSSLANINNRDESLIVQHKMVMSSDQQYIFIDKLEELCPYFHDRWQSTSLTVQRMLLRTAEG